MNKIEIDIEDEDEASLIMRKFGYVWFLWGTGIGFIFGSWFVILIYFLF